MSSVLDDIKKRRTRQSVGEQQPTAPVEPVAPVAQPMGDQASARVAQGAMSQAESGFNPTAEQKATAMALMNPAAPGYTIPQQAAAPKQMTYTDLHKELYKPMTPEEKAAQQKRQRNRQIINAVGDGISALANLYYTNKSGVNAYDPSTSLTKAAKERYDKLLAQQREDEERYKELAYRSGAADIEMAYRRAKDAAAEKRADKAADDAAEARRLAQKNWQATFDYNKEKDVADRQERAKAMAQENAFKQQQQKALEEYRKALVESKSTTNAVRQINRLYGKPLEFARPGETNLEIYESVWKGSMPQVYAIMAEEETDIIKLPKYGAGAPSEREMQSYVKENWHRFPRAVEFMQQLSENTPARLISGIAENKAPVWGDDSNNDELDW